MRVKLKIKDIASKGKEYIGRYYRFNRRKGILIVWKYTEIKGPYMNFKFIRNSMGDPIVEIKEGNGTMLQEIRYIETKMYEEITDELELQDLYEIERNQRV